MRAFLKSIWVVGLRAKGRYYYWKLVFWSLFKRPQLLPLAVTLAVNGHHFRTVFAGYRSSIHRLAPPEVDGLIDNREERESLVSQAPYEELARTKTPSAPERVKD